MAAKGLMDEVMMGGVVRDIIIITNESIRRYCYFVCSVSRYVQ